MSFEVKPSLQVCFDCCSKKFTFMDNTGPYDSVLNPFGWQPNSVSPATWIQLDDVLSSALTITTPSGVVYGPYNVLASIPALDGVSHEIDLDDILGSGNTAAYEDGYWSFDWVVKGDYGVNNFPFHYRCLKKELTLCSVECCVDKLGAESDPSCGCSKSGNKKFLNAMLTLAGINAAHKCGKQERAKELLTKLQSICNNTCKNC